MRHILMAAAVAATLAASFSAANAFPIAPVAGVASAPEVTLISGGCGPFGHRGFYGGCRPNFRGPRPFFHPYGYGPRFHHPFYHRRHFY